ncbi:MAG: DUF362 domain-containing protein [Pseudomonadota bacterium]
MAQEKIKVSLVQTGDRTTGVKAALQTLGVNPVKGLDVLIKPNFNTADPTPGSTHNDTLAALIREIWSLGAKSVSLGERSYPPTREVMEKKQVLPLLRELDVRVIDFDDLPARDWVEIIPTDSHWKNGFRVARPILESECLVYTCCLKTHQFGGVFTMSLKLSVGVVPTSRHGFEYMRELHSSPRQREMIAEINAPFKPSLVVLDGVEAFVDGGPAEGRRVKADVFLASTSRVAVDAVGVAMLKDLGSTPAIMGRKIFEQEQLARALQLGLGPEAPTRIEILAHDEQSQAARRRLSTLLDQG